MIRDGWREKYEKKICELGSLEYSMLVKLHNEIAKATFMFFLNKEMAYIPVPSTTGSASSPMEPGSDSAPVIIKIKNKNTMLTDSAQFHLEYACRVYKKGCFYFGNSFRDEEPDERHLAQFNHAEAEVIGTLEDVKELVEQYIKYVTKYIWENIGPELESIPGIKDRVELLLDRKFSFRSITFAEACEMLNGCENALEECETGVFRITSIGEKIILENLGEFVWIECWDKMAVPFYQAYDKRRGSALNADLLFGIGEVVGAGQRHCKADELLDAIDEHRLLVEDYKWYVEMKEQFPLQTAGFGMGIERYLMWFLGVKDIRSVEIFPRNNFQMGEI